MVHLNCVLFAVVFCFTVILADPVDHKLNVRSVPAVTFYGGVINEPLFWSPPQLQILPLVAKVNLKPRGGSETGGKDDADSADSDNVAGELTLIQTQPPHGPLSITGKITGLTPGKHGLHFHMWADFKDGCSSTGAHFNPYNLRHGDLNDPIRHVGDLGNIEANANGEADIRIVNALPTLDSSINSVVGRSLVVHADPDDQGLAGTADSVSSGSSGKRLACGFVGLVKQ